MQLPTLLRRAGFCKESSRPTGEDCRILPGHCRFIFFQISKCCAKEHSITIPSQDRDSVLHQIPQPFLDRSNVLGKIHASDVMSGVGRRKWEIRVFQRHNLPIWWKDKERAGGGGRIMLRQKKRSTEFMKGQEGTHRGTEGRVAKGGKEERREYLGKEKRQEGGKKKAREAETQRFGKKRDQYRMPVHVAGPNRSARRRLYPRV